MCGVDAGCDQGVEGGWTSEQCAALEEAYFRKVDPLLDNHWQVVAQHVPGKSAQECFNKVFEKYPTPPVQKSRQPRTAAAAKPPTAAAARPTASLITNTGAQHATSCQGPVAPSDPPGFEPSAPAANGQQGAAPCIS